MTSAPEGSSDATEPGRRRHRASLILVVALGALGCLALGWWQWTRYESAGGTGQNLGYALQWPLFAVFVVYAYRRFVQLEDETDHPTDAPAENGDAREVPAGLLPERPTAAAVDLDPQMREYNRYLAELAAGETDRSTT